MNPLGRWVGNRHLGTYSSAMGKGFMETTQNQPASPESRLRPYIRPATDADHQAIAAIYAHHVLHGLGTFEETPPSPEDISSRRGWVLSMGLPYLVAEVEGQVAGFCYASEYRSRPAYCYTIEDSVYVRDGLDRRGVGTALLKELIARCQAGPWRQMVAVIGDSANAGSIALHGRCGFEKAGALRGVGFKLGRWVDTVLMQRALGPGDSLPPGDN